MSTLELRINDSEIYHTLVRECYQKTNYIIVQQHKFDDVWSTTKSLSVPKSIVAEMLLFFEEKRAQHRQMHATMIFPKTNLKNQLDLPEKTKSIFYFNDCESMPMYENQERFHRDLEMLKEFWGIEEIAEYPQSPDSSANNAAPLTTTPIAESNVSGIWPIDDTPSVSPCLARRKSQNLDNSSRSSGDSLQTTSKFKFSEIEGDLFTSKDSLAHCVSTDLKMSAGIAKEFRYRFERVEELKRQHRKVGEVAVLRFRDRFIYYLITKEFYYKKPSLSTLKRSLEQVRDHGVEREIER